MTVKTKILLFLAGFVFLGSTGALAASKISLSRDGVYDLGNLKEGILDKRSFAISNLGDSDLEVRAVSVSCGCTSIIYPKKRVKIPPGKSIEVRFSFNTEGMDGEVTKYIYIESNDPQEPQIKLKLTARVKKNPGDVVSRFISFGLFTVISAGLMDGVNPCAFTVLVFFISFLTFVGYKRKELIVLGATFISAVFITYILIGLGIFKFIHSLEAFSILSKITYLAIAWLAIVLGFFSLYDWYVYRKTGNPEETRLRLPNFIKHKIQKIIQASSRDKKKARVELVLAIFISGFLVSLLESICTGQTYLPTIVYVLKNPGLRGSALLYLVLYNTMFIIPLAIIFIAALLGVSSETFTKLARKHLGIIKLLSAGLFFMLGIFLLVYQGGK